MSIKFIIYRDKLNFEKSHKKYWKNTNPNFKKIKKWVYRDKFNFDLFCKIIFLRHLSIKFQIYRDKLNFEKSHKNIEKIPIQISKKIKKWVYRDKLNFDLSL